ncbi:MAG TPA: multifunctional CCA tRNA nucleotidyl transferase/2'3'-cyclic phosphodiesterase/2'nucleotidase/phosphatase [Gammaproteobacteria bacterium]|jgi:tRNA nucleotidyltransferase (CCA-adding enzyme)|nr:multifunctional CCA tRNA nucleotidyl transferase/2'3'-cyclic phosphodiesterase/2'nucleotidase/phosphatase [Gammaproteobacteria bacterium]
MKIYLVGGAVRDKLLGLPVKERDWVIVGATSDDIQALLREGYRSVGKEFPVFLHPNTGEEYALARIERKTKPGYQGFSFETPPTVSLAEDLLRRDLTINAMAEHQNEIIDPYHGKEDLAAKRLRHVSSAFAEDPVRILRVGRFLARYAQFGFSIAEDTIVLMRHMVEQGEVNALVAERVWKELERALGEKNPEKFFEALDACDALAVLFPHLASEGSGIAALKAAAKQSTNAMIRFACLLSAHPETISTADHIKVVKALCSRYRVPHQYQQLAVLVTAWYETALSLKGPSADVLLDLLTHLDSIRREERFNHFISAVQAIAESKNTNFNPTQLQEAARMIKSIDVQEIIATGCQGQALAAKIKEARYNALDRWLQIQS